MRLDLLCMLPLLFPTLAHAQGSAPPQAVAVYRGSEANVPPAIRVLRGSSAHGQPSSSTMTPSEPTTVAVGGGRLWLIDPEAGELVGCRLGRTVEAGTDRIRCTRRALP